MEIQPSWSPDGRRIAYIAYALEDGNEFKAGQTDIFIYDLQSQELTRATFTPDIIESYPLWISNKEIAYTMPELQGLYGERVPSNSKVGIGILNLANSENRILKETPVLEESFLTFARSTNSLILNNPENKLILDLDGNLIKDLSQYRDFSWDCDLLDNPDFVQLCFGIDEVHTYNNTSGIVTSLYKGEASMYAGKVIWGRAIGGGYVIADLSNDSLLYYSSQGSLLNSWNIPGLSRVFYFGANRLTFIPSQTP